MSDKKTFIERNPWLKNIGRNIFLFLAGLNYFGYIHVSWESFIKSAWLYVCIDLGLQVFLAILQVIITLITGLIARLGLEK